MKINDDMNVRIAARQDLHAGAEDSSGDRCDPVELVSAFAAALRTEGIDHCHWKSNEAMKPEGGEVELDLLVGRQHARRLREVLDHLGFKEARRPRSREAAGVLDYYGLDAGSGQLVHIHLHYRLVIGDDTTKNIRLPVEEAYLASSTQGRLFKLPSPEFEYAVLVIRMVLKHRTWDALVCLRGRLAKSERRELLSLEGRIDRQRLQQVLHDHLPFIDDALFARCIASLGRARSFRFQAGTGRVLQCALTAHARRRRTVDTTMRLWRRAWWWTERHLLGRRPLKRLADGGALIAIVGADGSGKSSAVKELERWLSQYFVMATIHLGKPPRSLLAKAVRTVLLGGRVVGLTPSIKVRPQTLVAQGSTDLPGIAWLVWHTLTARDRYRAYTRARRLVARGGLVVSDRYPLEALRVMDGPVTALIDGSELGALARRLADRERSYYTHFKAPDVLIVLDVDPEIAARRRADERPDLVRQRAEAVRNVDWRVGASSSVIDASRPHGEVLAAVKSAVWASL